MFVLILMGFPILNRPTTRSNQIKPDSKPSQTFNPSPHSWTDVPHPPLAGRCMPCLWLSLTALSPSPSARLSMLDAILD